MTQKIYLNVFWPFDPQHLWTAFIHSLNFLFRLPVIVHSLHQPFWPVGQPFICSTWWVVYKDIKYDEVKHGKMRLWLLKFCMEEDSPRGLSWNFITDFCCTFKGKLDSANATNIPHICHLDHLYIGGEKIGHVEKFQILIHNRCGEIRNFARFGGISKFYT